MKRLAFLLSLLCATTLGAADPQPLVGTFQPGQQYREPDRDAPPTVSRMFVRAVDAKSAKDGVDLPATGGGGLIILTLPLAKGAGRVSATLRTPTGDVMRSSERGSESRGLRRYSSVDAAEGLGMSIAAEVQEVISGDRTEAARYRLTDIALPESNAGLLVVAGEPDSRLTMTTTAGPLSRMPGEPVTLRATLRDGDAPIPAAHVVARLAAPGGMAGGTIELFDDGAHGDGAKDDGEYAAVVKVLPSTTPGFWSVRYDAEGTTPQGVEFERSGSSDFMNERSAARLRARSLRATIDGDVLRVTAAADVAEGGRYRFDVIVASARGANGERQGVAWGEAERTLDRGTSQLTLDIPLNGAKSDGLFVDVRLLGLDTMGVAGRATVDLGR